MVVLVGLGSFGLGRLSAVEGAKSPVAIENLQGTEVPQGMPLGGDYVASRSGSDYYFPWCSGAQKLAASNRIWFQSASAARAAGYVLSRGCKGLGA